MNIRYYLSALLLMLALVVGSAQAAVIQLTNQYSDVYDPANTYVPVGNIGPDVYSFQFFFSDPSHGFEITLQAPASIPGVFEYIVTSGLNAVGHLYLGDSLLAGESATFDMGFILGTSSEGLISQALSIRALGVTEPIPFGGESANDYLSSFGDGTADNGTGTGNDPVGQIPNPSTPWLLVGGLGLLAVQRRRRKQVTK